MSTSLLPFNMSGTADAALLRACGYVHEFVPAEWADIGGPESGPRLSGHPDMNVWTLSVSPGTDHEIVVIDGEVVSAEMVPSGPPGWEEEF